MLQSYCNRIIVLAQKQMYGSMEQNTKPRNKPCPIVNPSMTKETRLHSVGKTVSSTNGAEKPEQLHTKKKKKK